MVWCTGVELALYCKDQNPGSVQKMEPGPIQFPSAVSTFLCFIMFCVYFFLYFFLFFSCIRVELSTFLNILSSKKIEWKSVNFYTITSLCSFILGAKEKKRKGNKIYIHKDWDASKYCFICFIFLKKIDDKFYRFFCKSLLFKISNLIFLSKFRLVSLSFPIT